MRLKLNISFYSCAARVGLPLATLLLLCAEPKLTELMLTEESRPVDVNLNDAATGSVLAQSRILLSAYAVTKSQ